MDDEIMAYKTKLEARNADKPIWEKKCLSIEEAAAYSGIGITKLRQLSRQKKCPFVMPLGNQVFIVREKLDRYIKDRSRI
jgi:excisionase family DNA binding protein